MENVREQEEENRDMRIDSARINVTIREGEATLKGKVGSLQKKRLAEESALSVAGVDKVDNQLKVEGEGEFMDDEVRSFILAELANDGKHNGHQLDIEVNSGKVTLHGLVKNYVDRKNIIAIAQHTPGVVKIDNQIEVNRQ
jgi:hyperosmotically inducible protein